MLCFIPIKKSSNHYFLSSIKELLKYCIYIYRKQCGKELNILPSLVDKKPLPDLIVDKVYILNEYWGFFLIKRDSKTNFKCPSMQRWHCPIHNGTLESISIILFFCLFDSYMFSCSIEMR